MPPRLRPLRQPRNRRRVSEFVFQGKKSLKASVLLAAALAAAVTMATAAESTTRPATLEASVATQLPVMLPRVVAWAEELSAKGHAAGVALSAAQVEIARGSGVKEPARIRLIVVDQIPLPDEPSLKAAALQVGLSPASAAGMTIGYAVVARRGYETSTRLLSHEFRHVAQYEEAGGIRPFLTKHLADLAAFGYRDSPYERDARAHERDGPPVLLRASGGR